MTRSPIRLLPMALLSLAALSSAHAESLASSASSAGSASLGSISDSIHGSSDSSSPANKVAEGDYRIIEVAEAAGRPGMLRLQLQATERAGGAFTLDLPQATVAQRELAAGDVITARHRPYGLAFSRQNTDEPFFLVLADDWHGELDPRPVTL